MKFRTARTMVQQGFGLATIVLGVMILIAVGSAGRTLDALHWIEHTRQVQGQLNAAFLDLTEAENMVRRFSRMGDTTGLREFEPRLIRIRSHLSVVQSMTIDDHQKQRLAQLEPLLNRSLANFRNVQEARKTEGQEAAVELIESGEGYETMEDVRRLVRAYGEEETRMLGERTENSARWASITLWVTLTAGLIAIGVVWMAAVRVLREFDATRTATAKVQELNKDLEQLNHDLEHRARLLGVANKELEAFTYSVSHDLRAPLRHINGFADLLTKRAGASLDETCRRYLGNIGTSARRMGQLIDDLLVFSRMGRTEVKKSLVSMDTIIDGAIADLVPEIDGRKIEWKRHPLSAIQADPALMKLAWTNLLSNALKYTRKRPLAEIEIGAIDKGDSSTVFFIRDNGVGFDMTYVDKLFGVFQRLHRSEDFEGTGIGLANVHRIVVRHGGKTWAEGQIGEGATFYFSLPSTDSHKEPAH